MAELVGGWSKDPSTKVGAVIVRDKKIISTGFNGFPAGVDDDYALLKSREEKYPRIIHAELNAMLHAKEDLSGCTIYVVPLPPCSACAAAIVQSGISRVVTRPLDIEHADRWRKDMERSKDMFRQTGVEYWEVG